jgi:phage conserved hypothetical protein, phiE125 gp8 family
MPYDTGNITYVPHELEGRWSFALVTAPTVEPVTEAELRLHGYVTTNAQDENLSAFISTARDYAEKRLARQFLTATWDFRRDFFPRRSYESRNWDYAQYASIWIPKCPVQSVTSVKYIDTAGVEQTMDPSAYIVDVHDEPARVTPAFGTFWPVARLQPSAITVRFVAGYGDAASDVPPNIRHWIKLKAQSLFVHRESDVDAPINDLGFADNLLDSESWGAYP